MGSADGLAKHYGSLSGAQRFTLALEAMARGDMVEDRRLEDTCPQYVYRMDDRDYRGRRDFSVVVTLMACGDIKRDLARLRLVGTLAKVMEVVEHRPADVAEEAYYRGLFRDERRLQAAREAVAADVQPAPAEQPGAEAADVIEPEVDDEVEDLRRQAGWAMDKVQQVFDQEVGARMAVNILSAWAGLGRFCRAYMGVEPLVLVAAWAQLHEDPTEEVRALYPDAAVDEADAAEWYETFRRGWEQRFGDRHESAR